MTLSVWRYAHLALALVSCLFLLILSVTGVILAIGAVNDKIPAYRIADFDEVNLAQTVSALSKVYPELTDLTVDHNGFVTLNATDDEGNSVNAYINPKTGEVLGKVKPQSDFIQWNIALHRSLFLKETGRIIVGVVSFLLLLITVSGTVLIIKRQQGVLHFFDKIKRDFLSQYFHVVSGRLLLVPVFIIALTGTYLFMVRIGIVDVQIPELDDETEEEQASQAEISEFKVFQETKLSEVEKVEFPFMAGDPEEFYILKLKDRDLTVSQISGKVLKENKLPYSVVLEKLSLDLHTGRTNAVWAIILGLASLNILFFIYTGFEITLRRSKTKVKNKFTTQNAETIILVGSENGSTLGFANHIHKQLLNLGYKSYLCEMNRHSTFPKAKQLIVFTSTYGLGTAPETGKHFGNLLTKFPQNQEIGFSVVGFGSKAYADFCAFAEYADQFLEKQSWAKRQLPLHTVNDRSVTELLAWVQNWNSKDLPQLATTPALYTSKIEGLKKLEVVRKTQITEKNQTFQIYIKPKNKTKFQSGDLLAIYPKNDGLERLYSIGKEGENIQLTVKLHKNGLGSGFLYALNESDLFSARIVHNPGFHFPKKAKSVALIANGTGIAPFLGMIQENKKCIPTRLYAGFRYDNSLTQGYADFGSKQIENGYLEKLELAFSREENARYVMDLIRMDADYFASLLASGGYIMICGSLAMQQDVEKVLNEICHQKHSKSLEEFRIQILSDCY